MPSYFKRFKRQRRSYQTGGSASGCRWLLGGEDESSCNVRNAAAYSIYSRNVTRYAASWEEGDSFTFVLEYEFENQIMAALGYSLKWR